MSARKRTSIDVQQYVQYKFAQALNVIVVIVVYIFPTNHDNCAPLVKTRTQLVQLPRSVNDVLQKAKEGIGRCQSLQDGIEEASLAVIAQAPR